MITAIGFILALTIISSTNFYFDNSKQVLIEDYLSLNTNIQNTPQISISFNSPPVQYQSSMNEISNIINQTKAKYNYKFIKNINISSLLDGLTILVNQTFTHSKFPIQNNLYENAQVLQLNSIYLKELNQINKANPLLNNSRLPSTVSDVPLVYVLLLNNYSNQTVDENASISSNHILKVVDCQYCANSGNVYNVNVTGMGFLDTENFQCTSIYSCENNTNMIKYPQIESLFPFYNIPPQVLIFTPNLANFSKIIKPISTGGDNYIYNSKVLYLIKIGLDYSKIDPYNSISVMNDINSFDKGLSYNLLNKNFHGVEVNFIAEKKFQVLIHDLTNLLFDLILVSLPVLLISLFLIKYSFDFIHSNIVHQANLFKLRGTPGSLLLLFQLLDNLITLFVSIFLALIAGVPIEFLVSRSSFILSFNNPPPSFYILNFKSISTLLFYSAVIISFGINLNRLNIFNNLSIVETDNQLSKEEQKKGKFHLDYLIFLIGLFIYIVSYFLVSNTNIEQIVGPITGIQSFLLIPSLFALVIGTILLIYRAFPRIIDKTGTILWKKTGNIVAYSFKNISRRRNSSMKGLILISILMTFFVFFYSLPYSAVANNAENFYYKNGAEANASFGLNGYNATILSLLNNNFSQYLAGFSPYVILNANGASSNFKILLVNTSLYLNSSYLHFNLGLKHNIHKDFKNLKNSNSSNRSLLNVLIDEKTLKESKTVIGSNLSINNINTTIKLHVEDSFSLWPVFNVNFQSTSNSYAIGDISFYIKTLNQSLTNSPFSDVISQGIFLKFKNGVNQSSVISWIEGNTSITEISYISQAQNQFVANNLFRLEIGQVNINIIMLLIISLILLLMFSYQQYSERNKEIYTERALGIKLNQVIILFIFENFFLVVLSMLIGIGVGILLMDLLSILLLNPSQNYPPFSIVFPINLIFMNFLVISLFALCLSLIPAYFVSKQKENKSF